MDGGTLLPMADSPCLGVISLLGRFKANSIAFHKEHTAARQISSSAGATAVDAPRRRTSTGAESSIAPGVGALPF